MAAVCRRRATQFLSTRWRQGFDPSVVSISVAPAAIARAYQPRHRHQQGWMSSLSGVEESPSLLYPPAAIASSCNFSSSIHPPADNDEQSRRRRRWLSIHLAITSSPPSSFSSPSSSSSSSSSPSSSSSSSSFDLSSFSSCPCPRSVGASSCPPSEALLPFSDLPTQRRRCLSLFLPSPSSLCQGQGRPRGCQASYGDGGNRLLLGPRVLFSRISFPARGERYLPSLNLTRSVNDLSYPSSSSSPSSLSRGVSSQARTPSPVSLGTVQSVVDGDKWISSSSSSSSSSTSSASSYPSPSSSFWLSSSLSSSFSSSSSSSSPSSNAAAVAAMASFEPPISKEESTAAASSPSFSQPSVVDVNNKDVREEDKDLSPHADEQRVSVSAAADRDLDGANLENASEETTNPINQRQETDEAAEIGYSLIGKVDVKDAPYSEKPQALFAVVQVGSHQFKVTPGDVIYTEKLKIADVNDKVALEKVLLLGSVSRTIIGRPTIPGALVRAAVEEQALDAKVIIFKKKRRKNYRRTRGHRQMLSRLRILEIVGIEEDSSLTAAVQNVHEPEARDPQQEAAAVAVA